MKKIYLSLHSTFKPYLGVIGTYNLQTKRWLFNPYKLTIDNDLIHDLKAWGFGDCYFRLSRFKELTNAKFSRNREGEISVFERLPKLSIAEGVAIATKVYKSSKAQLENLKKSALTNENRYVRKVSVFTNSVLEQAVTFQKDGMALSVIAKRLNVNHESLRKTLRTFRKHTDSSHASL